MLLVFRPTEIKLNGQSVFGKVGEITLSLKAFLRATSPAFLNSLTHLFGYLNKSLYSLLYRRVR